MNLATIAKWANVICQAAGLITALLGFLKYTDSKGQRDEDAGNRAQWRIIFGAVLFAVGSSGAIGSVLNMLNFGS